MTVQRIISASYLRNIIVTIIMLHVILVPLINCNDESVESHGLGDHISWYSIDAGFQLAKDRKKPLMLIIHKSWCGACKALKPKFRESKDIAELSNNFVMVNTQDDDEPQDAKFRPDGGYIPRILFFDPNGEFLKDIINQDGNPEYAYYYYDEVTILSSMKKVLSTFQESDLNETSAANEKSEL